MSLFSVVSCSKLDYLPALTLELTEVDCMIGETRTTSWEGHFGVYPYVLLVSVFGTVDMVMQVDTHEIFPENRNADSG